MLPRGRARPRCHGQRPAAGRQCAGCALALTAAAGVQLLGPLPWDPRLRPGPGAWLRCVCRGKNRARPPVLDHVTWVLSCHLHQIWPSCLNGSVCLSTALAQVKGGAGRAGPPRAGAPPSCLQSQALHLALARGCGGPGHCITCRLPGRSSSEWGRSGSSAPHGTPELRAAARPAAPQCGSKWERRFCRPRESVIRLAHGSLCEAGLQLLFLSLLKGPGAHCWQSGLFSE